MSHIRMMGIGAVLLILGTLWFSSQERTWLDENHFLGEPLQAGSLTLWPLFAREAVETGDYRTLAEAQRRGEAVVKEHDDGASVESVVIENVGDLPLLILAGEIVVGGNQDRQIAHDLVVAAKRVAVAETVCVEQGRWNSARAGHATDGRFEAPGLVATQRVRVNAQYERDQDSVWQEIDGIQAGLGSTFPSQSFWDKITRLRAYTARARPDSEGSPEVPAERIVAHLKSQAGRGHLVGMAYGFDGRVAGARAFANPKLFSAHMEEGVRSLCIDAELRERAARARAGHKKIWLSFAQEAYDTGQYDLAVRHAEKVLRSTPHDEDAIVLIQKAHHAREAFAAWIRLHLDNSASASPQNFLTRYGVDTPSCSPRRRASRGRTPSRQVANEADLRNGARLGRLRQQRLRDIDWEAGEITFEQAISYLRGVTREQFVLGQGVREEKAEIEVELQVDNVSVVQVLNFLTEPHGMAWTIDKGVVMILVTEEVPEALVLRFHDVKDLVAKVHISGSSISLVPTPYVPPEEIDPEQEMPFRVDELIGVIEATVHAQSWGRDGTSVQAKSNVLVIRARDEVHRDIAAFLTDVREGLTESVQLRRAAGFPTPAALARAAASADVEVEETEGLNRNVYRRGEKACHARCEIRGTEGAWITLALDWSAR